MSGVAAGPPVRRSGEGGIVALELALVAPALALLALAVLGVLGPVTDQLAVEEAARAAARAVAVTGDRAAAAEAVAAAAPGATVEVDADGGVVAVEVTLVRDVLGVAVASTGRAAAACEPVAGL